MLQRDYLSKLCYIGYYVLINIIIPFFKFKSIHNDGSMSKGHKNQLEGVTAV